MHCVGNEIQFQSYYWLVLRSETQYTAQCATEDECLAAYYNKTEGICQMGELKYRLDLAKGVGVPVRVAKGHLPQRGRSIIMLNRT